MSRREGRLSRGQLFHRPGGNILASDALHDGAEAVLFIDADLAFHPLDALRLLACPESVIAGVYAKKVARAGLPLR